MGVMAPAPMPCSSRPATSTAIVGAVPPTTRPAANAAAAAAKGRAAPKRSASGPPKRTPTTLPRKNVEKAAP